MKKISNDLVSVIIPVFKNVSLLRDSLLSVEKQTYPFVEIIVVNDGSKSHQEINKIMTEKT